MSEQSTDQPQTAANAPQKKRNRKSNVPDTVRGIARARVQKRLGAKASAATIEAKVADECKAVRGALRSSQWAALTKAAPKSYGPKGSIKSAPNDRRPWGAIPATVARELIK